MATSHNTPVRLNGLGSGYGVRRGTPVGVDSDFFTFFDDFTGVALDDTNDWTVVADSGASAAIVADTVGGELALTSAATTENDGASVQGNEIFAVAAGKALMFETRLKCTDADQTDICAGLTVNFSTNPENMLTAADRIAFQVADGAAAINCITEKNGTATSTASGVDLEDDTYVVLGFNVYGTSKVVFYVNGKEVAVHSTNIPDDENLAIAAMSLSGSATGTRVTTLDYLLGVQER